MAINPHFLKRQLIKRSKYLAAIPRGAVMPSELIPNEWKGKRSLKVYQRQGDTLILDYNGYRISIPAHAYNWVSVFVGEIMFSDIYRLSLMEPEPGSFIYDCGANVGVFTLAAAIAFPDCYILAIEPEEQNRRYLQKNIELNDLQDRVFLYNAAVHRYDGETGLVLHESGDHYLADFAGVEDEDLRVSTVSMDSLAREYSPVSLIKMDVQGAELETVLGAEQVLRNEFPAWSIAAYHDENQFQALKGLFRYYDYNVRIHPGGFIYSFPHFKGKEYRYKH